MSDERKIPTQCDARRYAAALALAGWWGALTFYGAVVVPEGTDQFGSQAQGLVTQQVTRTLNLIGVAVAILSYVALRPPVATSAWAAWLAFVVSQAVLFGVHAWLSGLLKSGAGREWFYNVHRIYLLTTAVQWCAAPYLLWSILPRDR